MKFVFRLLCLLLVGTPLVARADTTYDFTASGSGFTSSGSFTVGSESTATPGAYDITSITGTYNGMPISLMPGSYDAGNPTFNTGNSTTENFYFDNLFYPSYPYLDYAGIGIYVGSSGYEVNFFYDPNGISEGVGSYEFYDSQNLTEPISLTIAPAPEPSSLLLLGTGVIGAAGTLRRRLR